MSAQLTILPANPVVKSAGTQAFSAQGATGAVTWTLLNGSVGSIDTSKGIFTAPVDVPPSQQWGGCQVLPNDHVYNMPVDTLPLDPASATYIAAGPNRVNGGAPGDMGVNSVSAATPASSLVFSYSPQNNGSYYVPARPDIRFESGADTTYMLGVDRHMITVAYDTCNIQEIYALYPTGLNLLCPLCNSQGGASYPALSYALPTRTTDAAGMLLLPAIYKKSEILAQSINHVGRFTMLAPYVSSRFVWPAQSSSGSTCSTCVWPMGARVRLQSSFNIASLSSPYARALALAWQKYGLILADLGSNWNYQVEAESYPIDVQNGFSELLTKINNTNFEVVDESSRMISATSGMVQSTFPLANSAIVVATDQLGHTASTHVVLQSVTLGTDNPSLSVQAGAAPFQVNVWSNGSSNPNLTWTLNGPGSLSATGIYTPPASVSAVQPASITVQSQANPSISLTIPVTIIPSGTIRVNAGDTSDWVDSAGNTWYGDMNTSHEIPHWTGYTYNQSGIWDSPDNTTLLNNIVGSNGDAVYRILVPNGNYQVQFLTGEAAGIGPNARCTDYEAQGITVMHNFDVVARTGKTQVGTWVTVPARVVDGRLALAARWATCPPGTTFQYWSMPAYSITFKPLLGAFRVVADTSPAHLTLDTSLSPGTALNAGQAVQFYAIGWYMSNSVTWSVSGPGSITSAGLYTAPSPLLTSGQVVITATSTLDPSQTASMTVILGGTGGSGSAAFIKADTNTRGSWKGVYGAEGYNVFNDGVNIPSYVTVKSTGNSAYTWAGSTTDPRALLKASSASDRIAACWYSTVSFSIDLTFNDANTHQVALYMLDWDSGNRSERIDILDPLGNVLDTRQVSSFAGGEYLVWNFSGHVVLRVTNLYGSINGLATGLFFGGGGTTKTTSASFVTLDTNTSGSWKGVYGADGYNVINDAASVPAYVTVTQSGNLSYTWAPSTSDPRALTKSSASERIAACWYSGDSFSIDLAFNDSNTHHVALYLLDWDSNSRLQRIDILDSLGNLLDTREVSSFNAGQYLVWNFSGHVVMRVTNLSGSPNAVMSGLFFGGGTTKVNSAAFLKTDTSTAGSWKGIYGADGYNVMNDSVSIPSYVTVTPSGNSSYTWMSSTSDARALSKGSSNVDRIAACWYSVNSFSFDLAFNDTNTHQVALYLLDWDFVGRVQDISILDPLGNVLDTRQAAAFSGGQYLVWNVSGHVILRVANHAGSVNTVASGLFFR